jgi:hypothetical protein
LRHNGHVPVTPRRSDGAWSTPAVRRFVTIVWLTAAWISAGAEPLVGAVTGATKPIDFARDYVSARARADGLTDEQLGNPYAASVGAPAVTILGGPYYAHPPPATLVVLPLVPLGFRGAALAWLAVNLAALAALAVMLVRIATRSERPPVPSIVTTFLLLTLWPPVLHGLAKGQWSILLAALVAVGWDALERGRPRAAGVWLGVAASLKVTPLLLLGYLVLRQRRAAKAMVATIAASALVSLALFGVGPWRAWIVQARPNALAWQTWIANTASINGVIARLFAGGAFARPLYESPALAQALTLGLTAFLIALAFRATRAAPTTSDADRRLCAAWIALVVVLNPISWTHTVVIALVPLALLFEAAPRGALAAVLILLTVPRETLAALAGRPPVSPGRGLVLSLHAWTLLLLFGVSLRTPGPTPRDLPAKLEPDPERSPEPP